jgi:hypothetical protein
MGKPSAPPAPDYAAAARAQGTENIATARTQARLNTPNTYTPYGSQTVSFGSPTVNQAGYDQAMQDFNNRQEEYDSSGNVIAGTAPTIEQFTTAGDSDTPTIRQTLNPESQAALEAQQRIGRGLSETAEQFAMPTLQRALRTQFDPSGYDIQTSLGPQMPVNYGPAMGQYGMAGSVPSGAFGQAGSVGAGQYGTAQGGVAGPNLQTSIGGYGDVQNAPTGDQYGQAGSFGAGAYGQAQGVNAGQFGGLRTGADMSGVAAMPVNAGMTGQQAIMARLQPQLAQQSAATAQQLANQGITPGSEAYNNAMRQQQQSQNDLLSQAALQGIGLDMSANQQGYGQAMGQAGMYNAALGQGFGQAAQAQQMGNQAIGQNFGQGVTAQQLGNQAIGQNFGQGMQSNAAQNAAQAQRYGQAAGNAQFGNAAQLSQFQANLANQQAGNQAIAQNYGQGMSSQQLQNQAIGQNYGQGMSSQDQANAAMAQNYGQAGQSAGLYNQAAAQQYNQNLGAAQFGNQAQQQRLQQNIAMRNQPLNEIMGLLSGSQIQTPQFQAYQGGGNIQAAPVAQAATNQGNYDTAAYNAKMQALGGLYQGIGSIAGGAAAGGMFSDIRLKSNIVKVGDHPKGFGIYEYDIFGRRERGVMAQEVEKIIPEAVLEHPSGYKMVNYGAL